MISFHPVKERNSNIIIRVMFVVVIIPCQSRSCSEDPNSENVAKEMIASEVYQGLSGDHMWKKHLRRSLLRRLLGVSHSSAVVVSKHSGVTRTNDGCACPTNSGEISHVQEEIFLRI